MSWSDKYKRSIDCDNPKGFSQRAHCQGRKKKLKEQLKPFKTVEQIAKKHRLDVSFIQKQLDMGEPIEHEHTKDHKLAMEIALQHLDEIPDYYNRLKKMEASAKKEHKKFKDVKEATDGIRARDYKGRLDLWFDDGGWVQAGGRYDGKPCAKQPGQTTKPYCRDPDDRAAMSKEERNKRAAKKRKEDPNPNRTGKAKMVTQEAAGEKDACYKKVKSRYKVWPSAYASGALVKCRKVGADSWGTKSEQVDIIRYCPKCKKDETRDECKYGTKYWDMYSIPLKLGKEYTPNTPHPGNFPEGYDHEYSMARSEISTIISAAKRLKKKIGKGEGNLEAWVQSKITKAADYIDTAADYVDSGEMKEETTVADGPATRAEREKIKKIQTLHRLMNAAKLGRVVSDVAKESVSIEDANGNTFAEIIDIIGPNQIKPIISEKCWKGYKRKKGTSEFEKGSCVKAESKKTFGEFMAEASPAWQRKAGKNPEGGLNKKGIASYRREHPGSKLSLAVTTKPSKLKKGSKKWKRRKSFCARMSGMPGPMKDEKGRPTRKALSLRKWNC